MVYWARAGKLYCKEQVIWVNGTETVKIARGNVTLGKVYSKNRIRNWQV